MDKSLPVLIRLSSAGHIVDMFPNLAVALVFLLFWTTAEGQGAEVLCVHQESCVLPCSFQTGTKLVIDWRTGPEENIEVHDYYDDQNQLQDQHQNYRNRTSLFDQELSTGNASLLLSGVRVQDEGRYWCDIKVKEKRSQLFSLNLKVHGPVLGVSVQQEEEQLLCRSEGVYPKPSVSWTPSSAALTTFKSPESGVWSVLSSVSLTHGYSCNVSTPYSWKSATYRRNFLSSSTGSDVAIPCSESPPGEVKSLVWTFNKTETILNQTGSELVYSESWTERVTLLQNTSLFLKGLAKEHEGLFSCVLTTDSETITSHTELEITEMEPGGTCPEDILNDVIIPGAIGVSIGVVTGAVIGASITAVLIAFLGPNFKGKIKRSIFN